MAERFKAVVLKTTGGLRLPWVRIPPPPPIPDAPRLLASLLACLGLAACGGAGGSAVGGCPTGQVAAGATCSVPGPVVSVWVTWPDRSRLVARDADLAFLAGTAPAKLISVDPATRFQSMVGFGATLTDASALNLTTHLADPARAALLAELFGRTGGGLGLSFMRLPIGASDFSTSRYTFDDMPAGQVDDALAAFSIAPLQSATLPLLKAALAANPSLRIMATPWSPPAWMKTNDSLVQVAGITATLRPAAYGAFARYLGRFADAMEAEGVPLYALSLQNEPGYEPPDYPGMRLDTGQRALLLGQYVGPLFAARANPVRLLEWDHNWDAPGEPLGVLADATARPYVGGVAWHCYAGDPTSQAQVHDAYPDKDTYFTECSGGGWAPVWQDNLLWMVDTLLIGTTRNWARAVMLHNLALDETGGPHDGGCGNCRGVLTIDSSTGQVTRNEEYYALAHFSRFVRPGAERVASTTGVGGLDSVAFRNADDGSVVLVVANTAAAATTFGIVSAARTAAYTLPAGAVATFTWAP